MENLLHRFLEDTEETEYLKRLRGGAEKCTDCNSGYICDSSSGGAQYRECPQCHGLTLLPLGESEIPPFQSVKTIERLAREIVAIPSAKERQLELEVVSLRQRLAIAEAQNKRLRDLLARSPSVPFEEVVTAINGESKENF